MGPRRRRDGEAAEVSSGLPLVSVPGSKAAVLLGKNSRLTLWGNIPEILSAPPVECVSTCTRRRWSMWI